MPVWAKFTSQKQWEVFLKELVSTNDRALFKSIILIYNNQTNEEKTQGKSIEDNYVGFTKTDAYEMGQIAKKIKCGQPLTKGELAKSRNKMKKYWKQLMIISKEKAEAKELQELERELYETEEGFGKHFKEIKSLQKCEEGIPCEYGICKECPMSVYENGGKVYA